MHMYFLLGKSYITMHDHIEKFPKSKKLLKQEARQKIHLTLPFGDAWNWKEKFSGRNKIVEKKLM